MYFRTTFDVVEATVHTRSLNVHGGIHARCIVHGDAHSSTVIDAATGKLVTNIPLGGKPEYGVSAGDGKVYAKLTDNGEVVEIDSKTLTVTRRWATAPCKNPVAMAIDTKNHRLFSGRRSGVMAVSDYAAGKIVTTVPIGPGTDGAAFDPSTGDASAGAPAGRRPTMVPGSFVVLVVGRK